MVATTARLSSLLLPYTFSAFFPASCFLILTFWGMSFSLSRKLHDVTSSRLKVRALSAASTLSLRWKIIFLPLILNVCPYSPASRVRKARSLS